MVVTTQAATILPVTVDTEVGVAEEGDTGKVMVGVAATEKEWLVYGGGCLEATSVVVAVEENSADTECGC